MDKIWVLGDAVVDLLPEGDGKLLQCPGGAPANVAVGIARLGGKSAFIGRVGDDPFGRFMQKTLADEQVDVQWMRLDPAHRTSTVVVDRTLVYVYGSAERRSVSRFHRSAAFQGQRVAARLLHCAQRGAESLCHFSGDGCN